MKIDLNSCSKEFRIFYEAFAFETYGKSMGRAAEHAAVDFQKLNPNEQHIGIEWFLELFKEEKDYYAIPYLQVVEYSSDIRFLPYLKNYYKILKRRSRKYIIHRMDSEMVGVPAALIHIKPNFNTELSYCKKIIKLLKHSNKTDGSIKFVLKFADTGPDDLQSKLPMNIIVIRRIPGSDTNDYWLAKTDKPIVLDGKQIQYLIIGARFAGESLINSNKKNIGLNIAYVIDESILNDDFLDFKKAKFIAICLADRLS